MARDDDGDGILRQGLANVSGVEPFTRWCQDLGNFAVGASLARGDFSGGFVHLAGKGVRSGQVHGNAAKVLKFALKMLADFLDDFGNARRRRG